jgi:hypothetical protein
MRLHRTIVLVAAAITLTGCGLSNPQISEVWDTNYPGDANNDPLSATAQIELGIRKRVYCELKRAVLRAQGTPVEEGDTPNKYRRERLGLIPDSWIARISLSLQVDETSAANPGISINDVYANAVKTFGVGNSVTTPQSFTFGLGSTFSSVATRIDKFNPAYSIAFLSKKPDKYWSCNNNDPWDEMHLSPARSSMFLLESSLGIEDWLLGATYIDALMPSDDEHQTRGVPADKPPIKKKKLGFGAVEDAYAQAPGGGGGSVKPDTISYEIKFVIVTSGNINPTWKLVKLSANTGSAPFLQAGRTRTHDLVITIGPNDQDTANAHFINQQQQAFGAVVH